MQSHDIAAEERQDDDDDTPRAGLGGAGLSAYTLTCLESELGIRPDKRMAGDLGSDRMQTNYEP